MTTRLTIDLDAGLAARLRFRAAANHTDLSALVSRILAMALSDDPGSSELAAIAQHGGAFDWLADEPDIYTVDDGEPVRP